MDIGSEGVVFGRLDLVEELRRDNRSVAGVDSEVVLVKEVPQLVAAVLLGAAAQELTAGCVHQECCQPLWNQQPLPRLSHH